jgi:hypothetical protein
MPAAFRGWKMGWSFQLQGCAGIENWNAGDYEIERERWSFSE